jgi:hypothetical protein
MRSIWWLWRQFSQIYASRKFSIHEPLILSDDARSPYRKP